MVAGHGQPTGRPADPTPAPQQPKTATGGTRQLPPARRHQPALREVRERAGGEPDRGGGGRGWPGRIRPMDLANDAKPPIDALPGPECVKCG